MDLVSAVHVFCDASKKAIGACAYVASENGSVLVYAKGKIIKRKGTTIPSNELSSGELGVRVGQKVARALELDDSKVWYWLDALSVLGWIKAPPRSLPYHVARISSYIRQETDPNRWRHVPTKLNPADLISRGATVRSLVKSELWLRGPGFLTEGDWPPEKVQATEIINLPEEEELTRLIGIYHNRQAEAVAEEAVAPLTHVGNFRRALRVLSNAATFIAKTKSKINKTEVDPEDPLHMWLRLDQSHHFPKEIGKLQRGQEVEEKLWLGYNITWTHGVIHIGGRTKAVPVPLLHKDSHLAKLWLLYIHNQVLRHAGGEKTLKVESRRYFWVFRGTSLFRAVARKCTHCRRRNPHERPQIMAPLPAFRQDTSSNLAFQHCAVDFAGPWTTKVSIIPPKNHKKNTEYYSKRYLLLICCGVYRAVHCEITDSRSTLAVLLAFQRFAARHRIPSHIHSDNAKEFQACAQAMRELEYQNQIAHPLSPEWNKVIWTFCHPRAPHSNGIVESLIGVSKRAIEHALAGAPLTEDVLRTAASYAESVVNSRPIGTVSEDPEDPQPLTPGMFTGQSISDSRELNLALPLAGRGRQTQLREQWKIANQIQKRFTIRFKREVIPELMKREKWWDLVPEPKEGDIVIVMSYNPNELGLWPLGKILSLRRGADGNVRGARVKVGDQELDRHLSQLVPLL